MRPKDADGMANRVVPSKSSPIWVCVLCYGLSVPIFRISIGVRTVCDKVTQAPSDLVCYLESKPRLEEE